MLKNPPADQQTSEIGSLYVLGFRKWSFQTRISVVEKYFYQLSQWRTILKYYKTDGNPIGLMIIDNDEVDFVIIQVSESWYKL